MTREEKLAMLKSRIEGRKEEQERKFGEVADKYMEIIEAANLDLGVDGFKFIRGAFMDGMSSIKQDAEYNMIFYKACACAWVGEREGRETAKNLLKYLEYLENLANEI